MVATARKDVEKTKHELLDGLAEIDQSRLTVLPLDVLGKFCKNKSSTKPIMSCAIKQIIYRKTY